MRVWNIYDPDCPEDAVYCGRGSQFGNRFEIGDWWPEMGRRMTRDDVCDRYRDEELPTIDVSELKGQDLKCFCKPKRCHVDDIFAKANGL